MITADRFRAIALAFEGTAEAPHMERTAFRTTRRIFVTLSADGSRANVMLTPELQQLFVLGRKGMFTVIPNGWGAQGWTTIDLALVDEGTLTDALRAAHAMAKPATKKAARTTTRTTAKKSAAAPLATANQKATKAPS